MKSTEIEHTELKWTTPPEYTCKAHGDIGDVYRAMIQASQIED